MLITKRFTKSLSSKHTFIEVPMMLVLPAIATTIAGLSGTFVYQRYHIAKPDQYLIRTGLGIKDVGVSKQGLQWPFQMATFVSMNPSNNTFELHAMSSEKLEFVLPGVFTIGIKDDIESIKKYAKHLKNQLDTGSMIKGILEGETRVLAGKMTIEEIFNGREEFKKHLITHIQEELNHFGLVIYNANIKELQDAPGSEYFQFIRQKKRSEADNISKVDVAEATKKGDVGQKERVAETRQNVARLESETVLLENERRQAIEKSNADLAVVTAEALQKKQIAQIETDKATKMRDAELQMKVEQQRITMETEKMRATDFSKSLVTAEVNMKNAEGRAKSMEIEAMGKANAMRIQADATLYLKEKEAKGILEVLNAESEGYRNLIGSFGNNTEAFTKYLMIEKGIYEKLAKSNAEAISGLNPKVTTYNLNGTTSNPIADIFKMIPPLVDTMKDQIGMSDSSNKE